MFKRLIVVVLLGSTLAVGLVAPTVAHAQADPRAGEKLRLEEEMKKLAQRNAWTGVEEKYEELVALNMPLTFEDHFTGAQAARNLGRTYETYTRLNEALKIQNKAEIVSEIQGIDAAYGRVKIAGMARKFPPLAPAAMPFAPDERKSVEYAQGYVTNTGSFDGMLPVGDYTVGVKPFHVTAGQTLTEVPFTKEDWAAYVKGGAPVAVNPENPENPENPNPTPPETKGLIWYSGPVVLVGYNFLASGAPADPGDATGRAELQPDSFSGSGMQGDAGVEIGFTDKLGVAGTVGYRGIYGLDGMNGFGGWLAGTFRPGQFRVAFGPTYGLMLGKGTGVASWWDKGQDKDTYPTTDLSYHGFARLGGLQATAGYGVLQMGPLMGLVEIGGAFASDGRRSYVGAGLRIGIVPWIERYHG